MTIDGVPEEIALESLGEFQKGTGPGKRDKVTKEGQVTTTMPGNIVDVLVKEGADVAAGDPVLVIEAMKMETEIKAPVSGKVTAVHIQKGDRVTPGDVLVEIG
jgi:pyruvate carboxylase subunit B